MFRPFKPRTIRWRYLPDFAEQGGMCAVKLDGQESDRSADGMAVGDVDGVPFAVRFIVRFDEHWRTRGLTIDSLDGRGFTIGSDGNGTWRAADGQVIPHLTGCIDVDLQGTPFTNTLPIRRLELTPEMGPVHIEVAYIPFDTFEPCRVAQRYTCLEQDRRYFYENADGSFSAEVVVDGDGLVAEYPPLFETVSA